MTNQQGAEALAHELYTAAQLAPGEGVLDAVARIAALVEAQQPAAHVQNPAEIEHVAGDVSKNGPESNMAQQPAPSAAAPVGEAPLPLLVRDIAADLGTTPIQVCTALAQLGFGGHSVNMAVTPRMAKSLRAYFASSTPQADSQPAPVDLPTLPDVDLRDVGTTSKEIKDFLRGYATEYARAAIAARAPADSVTAPAGGVAPQYVQVLPKRARIPKDFLLPNCVDKQYNVGRIFGSGKAVWHTDGEGKFWCGQWHHRTPRELESECLSTLHDLWAIAGISQPTPPAQAADSVLEDAARLDWLQENSCDLRCIGVPTGGDDYDINWIVVEHHQATPHEREIGRSYTDDPRVAIDAARKQGANRD